MQKTINAKTQRCEGAKRLKMCNDSFFNDCLVCLDGCTRPVSISRPNFAPLLLGVLALNSNCLDSVQAGATGGAADSESGFPGPKKRNRDSVVPMLRAAKNGQCQ